MITSISLITSLGCSLKCEYCELARDEQIFKHLELQKQNIQALQDGTFLINVQKTLKSLNLSSEAITSIMFWGMEPTLTLSYITKDIQNWFKVFPNWNFCFFSTNGQQNYQEIFDFVQAASQNSILPFKLRLQISYDGSQFNIEHRHIFQDNCYVKNLYETLYKNILIDKKHHYSFSLYLHSVLTMDIINYLLTLSIPKLKEYFENSYNFDFIQNDNMYLFIDPIVGYGIEKPYNYTQENGKNIVKLLKIMLESKEEILNIYGKNILRLFIPNLKYNNMLNVPINQIELFCGNYTKGLYIRYDGTLVHCTSFPFKDKYNDTLNQHNYFYNYNSHIKKEFYDIYWDTLNNKSNIFLYNLILQNIKLLAKYNEIDIDYLNLDNEIIYKHILYILSYNCFEAFLALTNSSFLVPLGHIKLFCNGLCKLIDQYLNILIQE